MTLTNRLSVALLILIEFASVPAVADADLKMYKRVKSPDGKYALAVFYDGPAAFLRIYTRRVVVQPIPGTHRFKRSVKLQVYISKLCDGIDNVCWVPKHDHTLVFRVGDAYGDAKLALWSGGKRAKTLVRRRSNTKSEDYELDGVSKDGRRVYYGYNNDNGWKSYYIDLAEGSRPHPDYKHGAKRGSDPDVWDKAVIITGD